MQHFVPDSLRLSILVLLVFSPIASCDGATPQANATQVANHQNRSPNIVLMMVDDLGINGIGCYGSRVIATPNIDQLCREGMSFTQAYSGAPVCAPARCILLTGRHAGQCSVRSNSGGVPLPDSDVTIAEVLQGMGYHTGGFGKWALGMQETSGDPLKQGFEQFFGYYHQTHAHSHFAEYLVDNGRPVLIENNIGVDHGYKLDGLIPKLNPKNGKPLVYAPYLLMDRAHQFIRDHADEPFFCYLPLTVPHGHFHLPNDDPAATEVAGRDWSGRSQAIAGMTQLLDRQVGDLMSLLKKLDIADNTIVIFCSDHGAALRLEGELDASGAYRGKKRTVYEGGLRIPLIIHWPNRIAAGSQSSHVTYLGDLFATIADLAANDKADRENVARRLQDPQLSSLSLTPTLLQQGKQTVHPFLLWDFAVYNPRFDYWDDRMQAVRVNEWKLLRHNSKQDWELYNLDRDAAEQKNVADQFPQLVEQLESTFLANITPVPKQDEAMIDWMTPFTWANRTRARRLPTPTLSSVIDDSPPKFQNVKFGQEAVMLGATTYQLKGRLVQINIAWQLDDRRTRNRFIHICDRQGKIVRYHDTNRTTMALSRRGRKVVESIVLTKKEQADAAFAAIGFYGKENGIAKLDRRDAQGRNIYKLKIATFDDQE